MIERPVDLALSNSFGFGGHDVCPAIRRFEAKGESGWMMKSGPGAMCAGAVSALDRECISVWPRRAVRSIDTSSLTDAKSPRMFRIR
jgi:hypothetical protein